MFLKAHPTLLPMLLLGAVEGGATVTLEAVALVGIVPMLRGKTLAVVLRLRTFII